ncbi:MAG: hypothetical protein A2Z28_00390 [Chloroflexi bacterium RBG_16_51_9]|nr:MAG: hypothetical protein A2Z28_00390 [Chloroflexi bacterium RBG_16_51_9]
MSKISEKALKEVQQALADYKTICEENLGTSDSWNTYYGYAEKFVRWLKDDFTPGQKRRR